MAPSSSVERIATHEYLSDRETTARQSLIYGVLVREPAAPRYGHQAVVTRLTVLLDTVARQGSTFSVRAFRYIPMRARQLTTSRHF
jgi:hypothetical protein